MNHCNNQFPYLRRKNKFGRPTPVDDKYNHRDNQKIKVLKNDDGIEAKILRITGKFDLDRNTTKEKLHFNAEFLQSKNNNISAYQNILCHVRRAKYFH
jgi:hypothetical protein